MKGLLVFWLVMIIEETKGILRESVLVEWLNRQKDKDNQCKASSNLLLWIGLGGLLNQGPMVI
jgi:hypothetical protein